MKIKITFLLIIGTIFSVSAQVPQSFNYQAVVRNTAGNPVTNQFINSRISIRNNSSLGNILYQEQDTTTTNQFGLLTFEIGKGQLLQGGFGSIDWANGNKFLQVEIDQNGGTNFMDMGTTQLISVPYALYSDSSAKGPKQSINLTNDQLSLSDGGSVNLGIYRDTFNYQTLAFHNDTLSLTHGNSISLPYNAGMNFVVKINGIPITAPSINDVMIEPNRFLTENNYQYQFSAGSFYSQDSSVLSGASGMFYSASSACSAPFYCQATSSTAIKPGTVFNIPNYGIYYVPLNATPVTLTQVYLSSGSCIGSPIGSYSCYQLLPNNPVITGFNLGTSALITFERR